MDTQKSLTVSVVIPAFNEEKNLPRTLASLKEQTVKPFEIIVADNNSTDKTAEIAREYGAKVIPVPTQGNVYAMREGMNSAKGDVVAVIDADTSATPTWVESIASAFSKETIVGTTGGIKIYPSTFTATVNNALYSLFLLFNFGVGIPHLVGFNMAVRRSALEKVNGIDLRYAMSSDVELGLRLKKIGRVVYTNNMQVIPSMRRWERGASKAFYEYAKSYFVTVWLRRPALVKQTVIR